MATSNEQRTYKASLSKSQGRESWALIFRHPVRIDEVTGKPGKRVRRGLGTKDEGEARRLVDQMNTLLSDRAYWSIEARSEAERRFDPKIVDIFFHQMVPEQVDFSGIREGVIPLPTSSDSDYRAVLLLGTTGAGKTTLVRQLIGTDPDQERFPSVSTAKTTVADTEIVLAEGSFRAVVTFVSRDEVRENLEECMSAAVLAAYKGEDDGRLLRRLLNHVNQRFRFNYVLGNGPALEPEDLEDDDDETTDDQGDDISAEDLGRIDLTATNDLLESAISKLRQIAREQGEAVRDAFGPEEEEVQVVEEIFEDELDNLLRGEEAFHALADQLMDEIEQRFEMLDVGTVRRTKQGWPLSWQWESDDRKAFIKEVLRFSSNYAPLFGRLLTPLVNGIRVAGPFGPTWSLGHRPNLVLIDGEGLGHTPDSSSSISTKVSRQFDEVDAVLLVDNATQPMQAAPAAALRSIVTSGNISKLLVCFTHFDAVKGDNLPNAKAKEEHVLASVENMLRDIGEKVSPRSEEALRRRIHEGCFFVGGIQDRLNPEKQRRTVAQLKELLRAIDESAERLEPVESRPTYNKVNLVLAVRAAAVNFHDAWWPRLGLEEKAGVTKEHWTRIKALSRRLATLGQDEYDNLRPVADLHEQLKGVIHTQIQNPVGWSGLEPSEEEQQQVFNEFANELSRRLSVLATERVWTRRADDWREAYGQRGRGSTFVRAGIIAEHIYDKAAPIPDVVPSPDRNKFLKDVFEVVEQAAESTGVTLE